MPQSNAGYTGGEIRALVAPMLEVEPDDINHAVVMAFTMDGRLLVYGCNHAPMLLEMAYHARKHGFNPRENNMGPVNPRPKREGHWLARLLRSL